MSRVLAARKATLSCCMTEIIAHWAATGITSSLHSHIGSRVGVTRASNLLQLTRVLNTGGVHASLESLNVKVEPAPGRRFGACAMHMVIGMRKQGE